MAAHPTNTTMPELGASNESQHEPTTIKVAGWTCINTKLHNPPAPFDTSLDPSEDEEEDEEEEEEEEVIIPASSTPEADESPRVCEWEDCGKAFAGMNAPTLLYLHIVREHVGKPHDTQVFDAKCHWSTCPYSGNPRRLLLSHVMTHVPDYRPLPCDGCPRTFQRESNLRAHKKTCKGS